MDTNSPLRSFAFSWLLVVDELVNIAFAGKFPQAVRLLLRLRGEHQTDNRGLFAKG
jgi:hypothetical protein